MGTGEGGAPEGCIGGKCNVVGLCGSTVEVCRKGARMMMGNVFPLCVCFTLLGSSPCGVIVVVAPVQQSHESTGTECTRQISPCHRPHTSLDG